MTIGNWKTKSMSITFQRCVHGQEKLPHKGGGGTHTYTHAHVHESHGGQNTGGQNSFLLSLGTQMRVSMVTWTSAGKRPHLDELGRLRVHVVHVWLAVILFYTTMLFSSMHGDTILTGTHPRQTVARRPFSPMNRSRMWRGAARRPSCCIRLTLEGKVNRGEMGGGQICRWEEETAGKPARLRRPLKKLRYRRNDGKLLDALILKSNPFRHTIGIISVSKQ